MKTKTSSAPDIWYSQIDATLVQPVSMTVVKENVYILSGANTMSVCKGV